jgi:STE24 endopeptidase
VPVLGVYEWGLGARTRRANAALVGSGATRRILISDTLLADYSEDEIEVILAHEMAHHVYKDITHGLVFEICLLFCGFYAAAVALRTFWQPLGLSSPSDVGGLPLLLIAGGAVLLAGRPFAHALSRRSERRADRFALNLTRQQTAFVSAMRRLALQNLVEESPSRAAVVLFHTHPPVEERIGAASGP